MGMVVGETDGEAARPEAHAQHGAEPTVHFALGAAHATHAPLTAVKLMAQRQSLRR